MGSLRAHSRSVQDRLSRHPASWMLPLRHTNEWFLSVLRSNPPSHMGTRVGRGHQVQVLKVNVSGGSSREKALHKLRSLIPTSIRALQYTHSHILTRALHTLTHTHFLYPIIHPPRALPTLTPTCAHALYIPSLIHPPRALPTITLTCYHALYTPSFTYTHLHAHCTCSFLCIHTYLFALLI
jgi:hypothetical protein